MDDDEILDLYGDEEDDVDENDVVDGDPDVTHDEFAGRTDAGGAADTDEDGSVRRTRRGPRLRGTRTSPSGPARRKLFRRRK